MWQIGEDAPEEARAGRERASRAAGLAGLSAFVGVALCGWALLVASDTRAWIARAAPAVGTVVALQQDAGGSVFPIVRFESRDGRTVTFRGRFGSSPPAHAIGERIPVLYDPARPEDARIATRTALWFVPLLAGGLGVLLCAISAGALLLRRRRAPRPARPRGGRSDRGLVRRR